MVEEAAHIAGNVERQELMDRPGRQALRQEACRGHGPRGHQDREPAPLQPLDQGQQRHRLADAGTMQPDQRLVRALGARIAAPFGQARRVFLAAPAPPEQQAGSGRLEQGRERAVGLDDEAAAHAASAFAAAALAAWISRRPAPGSRAPISA